MIPSDSKLIIEEEGRDFLYLNESLYDPLVCYEKGGVDLSQPDLGLMYQTWMMSFENLSFVLTNEAGQFYVIETLTQTFYDNIILDKLSFSFDQNMKLCWGFSYREGITQKPLSKYYWYDATINSQRELLLTDTKELYVKLDDKRPKSNRINDLVIAFLDIEDWLCVRYQRDRYTKLKRIMRLPMYTVIAHMGITKDYRFQVKIKTTEPVKHNTKAFLLDRI